MLRKVVLGATVSVISIMAIVDIVSSTANAANSTVNMSATINPSSTVEISANSVALNVVPSAAGTFKASTPLTVNAYTNSNYKCTITMETSSTSLTSGVNSIATLDNTYTESTFVNDKWGFSTDATNYGPVALTNSVGTFSSTTPNASSITFAAKLTQATKPGTYSGTVNFATTCTPPPISDISELTYMQDFASLTSSEKSDVLDSMTTGAQYQLKDSRDQKEYYISKLADGNVWMTANLNLAGGTALDADKTDVDSSYISSFTTSNNLTKTGSTIVLPASSTSGFDTDNYAYVYNSGSTTCGNNSPCYSYYSWDAATLGSGRSIEADNTNAPYSICPKGWKLPTTYDGSGTAAEATDFRKLMIALGGSNSVQTYTSSTSPTGATMYGKLIASPYNFLLAGYYGDGSFYNGGSLGRYWSATSYSSSTYARLLYFSSTYVYSAGSSSRRYGCSVRCVFGS